MALTLGARLGPYEITAKIGEGGMGEVYQATDTNLKRVVAIKVLPESVASGGERLARFQREAEVLASLNHPNIGAIYGLEDAAGSKALVMELVEGPTLADRIAQGAIPLDEALPIAKQITEALEAAHEQGIIHRDLKPANIKLRPDGVVKVLDFGLAKALEPTGSDVLASQSPTITTPAMTQAGMILGTAAYMSPEQAKGRTVDKRSDVWAFGAVLYEVLSGQRAFDGEDMTDVLGAVVRLEPAWDVLPLDTPPVLTMFLKQCLKKDPKQRVPDIAAMRLALEGAFETGVSEAAASIAVSQPAVWRRAWPLAVASLVTAVVVSFGWSAWPTSPEPRPVTRFVDESSVGRVIGDNSRPLMAFSPDGRHFVYVTREGLYLRPMEALEARLLSGSLLTSPFFSPDGQPVAYWDQAAKQLARVGLTGGAPVPIAPAPLNIFGASWAPDDTILFGQPEGILRVSANGGAPELMIPTGEGELMGSPHLLPDGESVLFSVTTGTGRTRWDAAQIAVQSLRTGERTVVLSGGSDARYLPTGHLVYALGDGLFAVAFDVDRLEVQGRPVLVVEGVMRSRSAIEGTGTANYGVSDQGTLVYLRRSSAFRHEGRLALVDRDGGQELLDVRLAAYVGPRLSPDGTRLVVQTREESGEDVVWVYDLSGDTQMRRLALDGNNISPIWTKKKELAGISRMTESGLRLPPTETEAGVSIRSLQTGLVSLNRSHPKARQQCASGRTPGHLTGGRCLSREALAGTMGCGRSHSTARPSRNCFTTSLTAPISLGHPSRPTDAGSPSIPMVREKLVDRCTSCPFP